MTMDVAERGKLDIGRVISETFQVLGRNAVAFLVLALLLSGVPTGIVTYMSASVAGMQTGTLDFDPSYFGSLFLGGLVALLVTYPFATLSIGTILYLAMIPFSIRRYRSQMLDMEAEERRRPEDNIPKLVVDKPSHPDRMPR